MTAPTHEYGDGVCPECGSQFEQGNGKGRKRKFCCSSCTRAYHRRKWRQENPEKHRASVRNWEKAHPDQHRANVAKWQKEHPDKVLESVRNSNRKLRNKVLDHYGRECTCCRTAEDLQIDHVAGDGSIHRMVLGNSAAVYRWLIKHDFPEGFQVLCGKCNRSKSDGPFCKLDHEADD